MLNKYLKTLAFILISLSINTFANEESAEYMDNGLPIHFKSMSGKTPIYIQFTDVIFFQFSDFGFQLLVFKIQFSNHVLSVFRDVSLQISVFIL